MIVPLDPPPGVMFAGSGVVPLKCFLSIASLFGDFPLQRYSRDRDPFLGEILLLGFREIDVAEVGSRSLAFSFST